MDYSWIPNQSFGPFLFGDKISKVVGMGYTLAAEDSASSESLIAYAVEGESIDIYASNERIECVVSFKKTFYKGVNIIGMTPVELESLLGMPASEIGVEVIYDNNTLEIPYEFDEFSLRVWVSNGKIVSTSLGNYFLD